MPTYQYACTACGHQLEAVQSFSDEPLTECPACEGRLRKLFNSVGIVFKGSGFYRTDSRGSDSGNGTAASKPAASGDSGSSSSSTTPASSSSSSSSNGSSGGSTKAPAASGASSS
ncbi:FmdB family zinc ribbon protein [Micromonospora sp. H33]|uniref:FmdB family zinc ribbon protein n=1 Tax=Micromonospora sp. H33 TaxID=3452215 RepID=UPI003F8C11C2